MVQSIVMCENKLCKARVHTYAVEHENKIVKTIGKDNHSATAAGVEAKIAKH